MADAITGSPMAVQKTGMDWDAAVRDSQSLGLPMWVEECGCMPDADDTNPAQTWSILGSPREVTTGRGYPMVIGGQLI